MGREERTRVLDTLPRESGRELRHGRRRRLVGGHGRWRNRLRGFVASGNQSVTAGENNHDDEKDTTEITMHDTVRNHPRKYLSLPVSAVGHECDGVKTAAGKVPIWIHSSWIAMRWTKTPKWTP